MTVNIEMIMTMALFLCLFLIAVLIDEKNRKNNGAPYTRKSIKALNENLKVMQHFKNDVKAWDQNTKELMILTRDVSQILTQCTEVLKRVEKRENERNFEEKNLFGASEIAAIYDRTTSNGK